MLEIRFNNIITIVIALIYFFFFNHLEVFYVFFWLIFLYFCMIPEDEFEEDFEESESFCLPWMQNNLKDNFKDKNIVFLRKYLRINKVDNYKKLNFYKKNLILKLNKLNKNYYLKNFSNNNFYSVLKLFYYNKFKMAELGPTLFFESTRLLHMDAFSKFFYNNKNLKYNQLNHFKEMKKKIMRFCWDSGDVGRKEISIFRDLFLAAYKTRDSNIATYNPRVKYKEPRNIYSDTEDFNEVEIFNGKVLKQPLNTFELFVSHREFEFDKERALFIRKKLKKEAKKRYAQNLDEWEEADIKDYPPFRFRFKEKRMYKGKLINNVHDNIIYFFEDNYELFADAFAPKFFAGDFFSEAIILNFYESSIKFNKKKPKLLLNLKNNNILLNLNKFKVAPDILNLSPDHDFFYSYRSMRWFYKNKYKFL